jgi:predicted amidohydrolase YtcJ
MTQIIYNALVYLSRNAFCEALQIDGDRITRTGSGEEILRSAPPGAQKIDAAGALVLPGFHDSHLHLHWLGSRARMIEGDGAKSAGEVIKRGRALVARIKRPAGTFIQGAGVNPDQFTGEKRDLTRRDLDAISRDYPIVISRHCGHTIYCNSRALERSGLGEAGRTIEGGTIEVDKNGRPTGILRENAAALVRDIIPLPPDEEMRENFEWAMQKALSMGITAAGSYDTGGSDFDKVLRILRDIYSHNTRYIRLTMQCGVSAREDLLDAAIKRGIKTGGILMKSPLGAPVLKMGPMKFFADGTLGGHTAWISHPYCDKPETSGFPVLPPEIMEHFILKTAAAGMQTAVHAIGDAGIASVVSAFEKAATRENTTVFEKAGKETPVPKNPLRNAVIHCQITDRALLERIARDRILTMVQPVFMADDMTILENRVGPDLAASSYAWGSMDRLGIRVSYGTDAPVSSLNPLQGISWAVNRRDCAVPDSRAYYPHEKAGVFSAVDAYTASSAYSSFDEENQGRIAPGFLADLVMLDRNIFSAETGEIHAARVLKTIVGGETVWEAE